MLEILHPDCGLETYAFGVLVSLSRILIMSQTWVVSPCLFVHFCFFWEISWDLRLRGVEYYSSSQIEGTSMFS